MDFRTYRVQPRDRAPLLAFILKALEAAGCQIIHRPSPETAPFRITYQAPTGERAGIVAYAFFANRRSRGTGLWTSIVFSSNTDPKTGASTSFGRTHTGSTPLFCWE